MSLDTILIIVSSVLGITGMLLGTKWLNAKGKLTQVSGLGKEAFDVVNAAVRAIEDDKITPAEIQEIKEQAMEVKVAWKLLIGKTD